MSDGRRRIAISACLLGVNCNYKGSASADFLQRPLFFDGAAEKFEFIPVCPEQLGGMSTPRIPSELTASAALVIAGSGSVVSREGVDVTSCFLKGGSEALRLAILLKADFAVFKSRSPSCGKKNIYDGTFSGILVDGPGITAQMFLDAGIKVFDEQEFLEVFRGTVSLI